VLPTYNRARRVGDALASVLAQTYRDLEVIVVDDASPDPAADIVDAVAGDDRRVQLVTHPSNRGAAAARNTAFARASGEVVAFIDDDDRWAPHKLARQVAFLEEHPEVDIVTADFDFAFERRAGTTVVPFRAPRRLRAHHLLWFNLPGSFVCGMVRRRGPIEKEIFLDESFPSVEDWDFWVRCARVGAIGVLPEVLGRLTVHGEGRLSDPSSIVEGRRMFRTRHEHLMSPACRAYNVAHETMELGVGWGKRVNVLRSMATSSPRATALLLLEQTARQVGKVTRDPALDCRVLTRAIGDDRGSGL
jgi:glycosyltransferase involved in cell wall biosynthesis